MATHFTAHTSLRTLRSCNHANQFVTCLECSRRRNARHGRARRHWYGCRRRRRRHHRRCRQRHSTKAAAAGAAGAALWHDWVFARRRVLAGDLRLHGTAAAPGRRKEGAAGHVETDDIIPTSFTASDSPRPNPLPHAHVQIDEGSAAGYLPLDDTAQVLAARFDAAYAAVGERQAALPPTRRCSPSGRMWRTYWRLYRGRIALHLAWMAAEMAQRVGAPLVLRQLITWLWGWQASDGDAVAYPPWRGWMWAALLGVFGYFYCLIHHQLFWIGMRLGFDMRQQAVAAVQAKVLRLNAVGVADQTAGKVRAGAVARARRARVSAGSRCMYPAPAAHRGSRVVPPLAARCCCCCCCCCTGGRSSTW